MRIRSLDFSVGAGSWVTGAEVGTARMSLFETGTQEKHLVNVPAIVWDATVMVGAVSIILKGYVTVEGSKVILGKLLSEEAGSFLQKTSFGVERIRI